VCTLGSNGAWRQATLTGGPPRGNALGETLAERGAVRYLGCYFSFVGIDGDRWHEQRRVVESSTSSFFAKLDLLRPTFTQYKNLCTCNILLNKVLFPWRVMPPGDSTIVALRQRVAARAIKILNLGMLGGGGEESVDAEALLAPAAMLGGGMPDVLPRITAALAVDLLTLRETQTPVGRQAVNVALTAMYGGEANLQRREEGRRAYPSMAASLDLMRQEGGLGLHASITRASNRRAGSAATSKNQEWKTLATRSCRCL
jgi:hypothetical protein